MIHFFARKRDAGCTADDKLTCGSVGIPVKFGFTEDWEGLNKIAVFRGSGVTVDVHLTDDLCAIPTEVLAAPGDMLSIGVYGTDGTGDVVIPTVYAEVGRICRGAEPAGVEPTPRTQPLIDQLLAAAAAALQAAQSVRDDADDGLFDGAAGAVFTPAVSQAGVLSWTNDGGRTNPQSVDLTAAVLAALPTWEGGSY